jgi:Predicted metal-dependent enzyme
MEDKLVAYGGQAVIEGVMMRGKKAYAVAMRAPDGTIITKVQALGGIYKSRVAKIPFLRGLIMLWDSLGLGMRALTDSANVQTGEDEKLEGPALYITLGLTFLAAIAIFFLAPAGVGWLSERFLHWNAWWSNLLEGVLRLLMLLGYLWAIGLASDISRVFAYHGAEHKTINAFEAGADMSPASVAGYSVEHPRCGTAFLLTLMVLSLFFFTILGPLPFAWRLISRVVMIPVLAGMAYEYLRWTADHLGSSFVRLVVRPNLALQHMTTRQPDEKMLEVAITAFQAMRKAELETSIN